MGKLCELCELYFITSVKTQTHTNSNITKLLKKKQQLRPCYSLKKKNAPSYKIHKGWLHLCNWEKHPLNAVKAEGLIKHKEEVLFHVTLRMKEKFPWTIVIFNMQECLVRLTTSVQHVPKQINWTGFFQFAEPPDSELICNHGT